MRSFVQTAVTILVIVSFVFLIYWLWQRQPRSNQPQNQEPNTKQETQNNQPQDSFLNIKDGSIIASSPLKISGKTQPNSKVLVFSNTFNDIATIAQDGSYSLDENLTNGLNLISVVSLDKDFKQIQKQDISLYLKSKNDASDFTQTAAGNVTKIFQNTVTVSTANGDLNVSTSSSTKYTLPTPPPSKSPQPKTSGPDIRVGDFIIALGTNSSDNSLTALQLTVIRDNKPTISKTYSVVKLASAVKQKIFSGTSIVDNKLIEFTLDKNAQIFSSDKKADEKAITKNQTAIIFYAPQNQDNIASLVYIYP